MADEAPSKKDRYLFGQPLTRRKLKALLHYDPDTGEFTVMEDAPGHRSGSILSGITTIIRGKRYLLRRLAFLYMTGHIPRFVKVANGNFSDNRWLNLSGFEHKPRGPRKPQNRSNIKFEKKERRFNCPRCRYSWKALVSVARTWVRCDSCQLTLSPFAIE